MYGSAIERGLLTGTVAQRSAAPANRHMAEFLGQTQVVGSSAPSSLTPRATILSVPSDSGRCSFKALSDDPVIEVSTSAGVVRITGIAFGWMAQTSEFGSVVRTRRGRWSSRLPSPSAPSQREAGRPYRFQCRKSAGGAGHNLFVQLVMRAQLDGYRVGHDLAAMDLSRLASVNRGVPTEFGLR